MDLSKLKVGDVVIFKSFESMNSFLKQLNDAGIIYIQKIPLEITILRIDAN